MDNIKVFVVTGLPRSGKDTVMDWIKLHAKANVIKLSMVDPAKEILTERSLWDEDNKTPESRKCLFELKNLLDKYYNYSYNWIDEQIRLQRDHLDCIGYEFYPLVVLICSKEVEDIKYLKEKYNANVVCIDDNGVRSGKLEISNSADRILNELKDTDLVDYYILNSSTTDMLYEKTKNVFEKMGVGF